MHVSPGLLAFASFVATAATIANAFVINKQFYPSIVYITKSNASMMVIYVQGLIFVYMLFQVIRKIFFGELRASEAEVRQSTGSNVYYRAPLVTAPRESFGPPWNSCFIKTLRNIVVDFRERFLKVQFKTLVRFIYSWLFERYICLVLLFTLLAIIGLSPFQHLSERAWHAVLETCLAFTVFRDDFSPLFVMQFVALLFVKCFHWLADDRVDMMERSPVITLKFHVRMMCIIAFLGATDSYLVSHAYFTTLLKGASSQIVFGFEYAILMALVIHVTIKYILHMHDLRTVQAWENKAVYLLYAELFINLIRCVLYGLFAAVMLRIHSFPLFSVRPFYLSLRALHKAANDVVLSRRAINAMNNLFPVVSAEDLSAMDATCIICRDEMTPDSTPKRLPCGHVFHSHCLRSWFQRQQTCPTCRTDILAAAGQQTAATGAAPAAAQPNNVAGVNGMVNARFPPNLFPFMAHHFAAPQPRPPTQDNAGSGPTTQNGAAADARVLPYPPYLPLMPFVPPMPPFPMEMPRPPLPLEQLSDEELRMMEGESRTAVERRIRMLGDISTLLDAAVLQMQHYTTVFGASPMPVSLPTTVGFDDASHTLLGQNADQVHGEENELNATQSDSTQNLTEKQVGGLQKDSAVRQNGSNTNPSNITTTGKSLFGSPISASNSSGVLNQVADRMDIPVAVETTELPSSSKETRAPGDEEVRKRRLRRFGDAGNSSEDL